MDVPGVDVEVEATADLTPAFSNVSSLARACQKRLSLSVAPKPTARSFGRRCLGVLDCKMLLR